MNDFMIVKYFSQTTLVATEQFLNSLNADQAVKSILILGCDKNNLCQQEVDRILIKQKKPVFGGVFPGIIYNDKQYEYGFLIAGLAVAVESLVIKNISSPDTDFSNIFLNNAQRFSKTKTFFVLIDGLSTQIARFIDSLFMVFGLNYNYIGGGAGSLSFEQKPCIITNEGLLQDTAIISSVSLSSEISVKHGWNTIAGPYKVTQAKGTEIIELDYQPAFNIYAEVVQQHSKQSISPTNFFDIAKSYPFGVNKIDAEDIVRDPISVSQNKGLICVAEVDKGAFVEILHGNRQSLINAAHHAVQFANNQIPENNWHFTFIVECISRVLFLEDDFSHELMVVRSHREEVPLIGILSLGEIANNGKDYLEFYNKTVVVGCF